MSHGAGIVGKGLMCCREVYGLGSVGVQGAKGVSRQSQTSRALNTEQRSIPRKDPAKTLFPHVLGARNWVYLLRTTIHPIMQGVGPGPEQTQETTKS